MKRLSSSLLLVLIAPAFAFAQATPTALSTDPQQIQNLIESQGCKYEITASAQTIASLQKRINDLEKQLAAKDPPKKK
jgi:septal ring factor EnvC (AmiA/AmiB activator)